MTAKLLEIVPGLTTMLASDVSAPSLEKARRLLGARGLSERANITVADGLSAVDRPVDAVMILGMGAGTILKIVAEGREKNRRRGADRAGERRSAAAARRAGRAGLCDSKEVYCRAAGRHYVTMLARAGEAEMPDERRADAGRMRGRRADGGAIRLSGVAARRPRPGDALAGGARTRRARRNGCLRAAMS